jgi:hypothetical protein
LTCAPAITPHRNRWTCFEQVESTN